MSVKTIGMRPYRKHIGICLYSGFVENKPRDLSTLVVAYPERGKSTEAKRFKTIGAIEVQDLSSWGLLREITRMSPKERDIFHHVVIPDLEKLASRSRSSREQLLSTMRILTEEGLTRSLVKYSWYNLPDRVTVGFILCTTPEDIGDRRSVFRSYSFLSRFIPFTYDFSDRLKIDRMKFVESEDRLAKTNIYLRREERTYVECADAYKTELDKYVDVVAREIDRFSRKSSISSLKGKDRVFGVRPKENFITYLKSLALYDGYTYVKSKHLREFKELFHFMNFRFNNIDDVTMEWANPSPRHPKKYRLVPKERRRKRKTQ